jgi:stress response protein YsnF
MIKPTEQMEKNNNSDNNSLEKSETIQVIQERIVIDKENVVTGKVKVHKTVSEELHNVTLPIVNEEYEVNRVTVTPKTLDSPPPALRTEGDTTIISVIREVTVVQKKYEVIEEIHITRTRKSFPLVHEINLKKEHVHIERTSTQS